MKEGMNQDKIQELNKSLVLNLIREEGVCSRALLSKLSGLNKATITYTVNEFILSECVEETGLLSNGKGRRSIGITLSDKKYYVIGIRLARTYFKVASFNLRGEMEDLRRIEISEDNPAEITFKEIIKVILSFIEQNQFRKLLLVGMAIPGPFLRIEENRGTYWRKEI